MPVANKELRIYADYQAYTRNHNCAVCGSRLVVLIERDTGGKAAYVIKCGTNKEHTGHAKSSNGSIYTDPQLNIYGHNLRRITNQMSETGQVDVETAGKLVPYTKIQVMTKDKAREIINLLWKNAPVTEKERAILLCASKNLNPLMKHIYLLPFNNKKTGQQDWVTIVSIQAKRTMASRRGQYRYLPLGSGDTLPSPRALSEKEARQIFGDDWKSDRFYVGIRIQDVRTGAEATAYKFWNATDAPYGQEKGNSVFNMASIRAETEALNKLYGDDDLPPDIMFMDARNMPEPTQVIEGEIVNTDTGEIKNPAEPAQTPKEEATPQQTDQEKKSPLNDVSVVCPLHKLAWKYDRFGVKLIHHLSKGAGPVAVNLKTGEFVEGEDAEKDLCFFRPILEAALKRLPEAEIEGAKALIVEQYNTNRAKKVFWSQIPERDLWNRLQKYMMETGNQPSMI